MRHWLRTILLSLRTPTFCFSEYFSSSYSPSWWSNMVRFLSCSGSSLHIYRLCTMYSQDTAKTRNDSRRLNVTYFLGNYVCLRPAQGKVGLCKMFISVHAGPFFITNCFRLVDYEISALTSSGRHRAQKAERTDVSRINPEHFSPKEASSTTGVLWRIYEEDTDNQGHEYGVPSGTTSRGRLLNRAEKIGSCTKHESFLSVNRLPPSHARNNIYHFFNQNRIRHAKTKFEEVPPASVFIILFIHLFIFSAIFGGKESVRVAKDSLTSRGRCCE